MITGALPALRRAFSSAAVDLPNRVQLGQVGEFNRIIVDRGLIGLQRFLDFVGQRAAPDSLMMSMYSARV